MRRVLALLRRVGEDDASQVVLRGAEAEGGLQQDDGGMPQDRRCGLVLVVQYTQYGLERTRCNGHM